VIRPGIPTPQVVYLTAVPSRTQIHSLPPPSHAVETAAIRPEKLGSEDRHRPVTAKLRNASNKAEPTDAILTVMAEIFEDDEWPIRPAAEQRMIKTQGLYLSIDVIGPES
jgi:hypothetical protein